MMPPGRMMEEVVLDAAAAVRGLLAGKATTLLSAVTLTMAMTATILTFSVVDGILIRPLPFGAPEELVVLSRPSATPASFLPVTPKDYVTLSEETHSFTGVAGVRPAGPFALGDQDGSARLMAWRATPNVFDVLQAGAFAGRLFGPEHGVSGGPADAILTHDAWKTSFGADASIVGRSVRFDGAPWRIIGVLAEKVRFPIAAGFEPDVYVPYALTADERANDRAYAFTVVARLRPGTSLEQARADAGRLASVVVRPLHQHTLGSADRWLFLVSAAAGLLLVLASLNVAGVQLSRTVVRLPELATREALGASRARLTRVLFGEFLGLAALSALVSVAISYAAVGAIRSVLPSGLSRVSEIAVDVRVVGATMVVALLCALLIGSSSVALVRTNRLDGVRSSGGATVGGRRQQQLLGCFLGIQVSAIAVLLVMTTLVVATFIRVTTADLGFERSGVARVDFLKSVADVAPDQRPFVVATIRRELLSNVAAVDGVSAVGFLSGSSPLSGGSGRQSIVVPGYGEVTGDQMPQGRTVDPGYFEVMGIDLIAGRLFTDDDRYGGPPVMLMSRLAAARYFPHADAVGQVVQASGQRTVIGVVEDVYNFGAEVETVPQIYLPADQNRHTSADGRAYGGLMIKTSGDPRLLESDIRRAIRSVAGAEPQRLFFVVDDGFRRLTEGRRFNARLMLAFGIVAVVIAGAGVYGTMAFLVRRNIRSIGLRMAVGAEPRDIRTWVLSKAARYVVPGMAGGLFAAWLSSSAFASLVFGVDVASMPVYLFVAGLLVALGFAAALLPARRAARLDPVVALRHE